MRVRPLSPHAAERSTNPILRSQLDDKGIRDASVGFSTLSRIICEIRNPKLASVPALIQIVLHAEGKPTQTGNFAQRD
jgi:hypothetical protein